MGRIFSWLSNHPASSSGAEQATERRANTAPAIHAGHSSGPFAAAGRPICEGTSASIGIPPPPVSRGRLFCLFEIQNSLNLRVSPRGLPLRRFGGDRLRRVVEGERCVPTSSHPS